MKGKLCPSFRIERGFSPETSLRKLRPVLNADSGIPFPQRVPSRKLHPTLSAHSGTQFPNGPRFGNHIPFRAFKAGRGFPREYRLLAVVVLGFFSCIELQHAAAVFAHGELGALQRRRSRGISSTGRPHHHRSYRQEDAPRPRCGHRCGRSPPRRKDARQSYRA